MKETRENKIPYRTLRATSIILLVTLLLLFSSCSLTTKVVIEPPRKEYTHTGWWVYGEGQHIFKDEETLEEYDICFPNEDMEELVELYLSVCEMEYFPMECKMTGSMLIIDGKITSQFFTVTDFEILYIQGCGE